MPNKSLISCSLALRSRDEEDDLDLDLVIVDFLESVATVFLDRDDGLECCELVLPTASEAVSSLRSEPDLAFDMVFLREFAAVTVDRFE